jgi:3-oxoacyl-[acyl-carrier protein] reductase
MVCPGYINTGNYTREFLDRAVDTIPLRRIGTPDDVAGPVCWLLTDEAKYVTGSIIDAGGGLWL